MLNLDNNNDENLSVMIIKISFRQGSIAIYGKSSVFILLRVMLSNIPVKKLNVETDYLDKTAKRNSMELLQIFKRRNDKWATSLGDWKFIQWGYSWIFILKAWLNKRMVYSLKIRLHVLCSLILIPRKKSSFSPITLIKLVAHDEQTRLEETGRLHENFYTCVHVCRCFTSRYSLVDRA